MALVASQVAGKVKDLLGANVAAAGAMKAASLLRAFLLSEPTAAVVETMRRLQGDIAVLGVVNTLALSVLERTRELGLLRAIGLGRAQTMRMVTVEAVVISVFGALLGVVVGAGLGAAVVRALDGEGITDLVLPWTNMGLYLGLAAVVGVLAAVLPSIKAARLNVLAAIAHE